MMTSYLIVITLLLVSKNSKNFFFIQKRRHTLEIETYNTLNKIDFPLTKYYSF